MRILFIGNVHFSKEMLLALISQQRQVVGVVTKEHSAFNADHVDLSDVAKNNGIPCRYSSNANDLESLNWIKSLNADIIFCFGWSSLLKAELLSIPRLGVVGYHPALLPHNRGRHPIIWALVLGMDKTGSTFFFMDEGADTGDILSQAEVPILPNDSSEELYNKLIEVARQQLMDFVPKLEQGNVVRQKQNIGHGNAWRKRSKEDGRIDWRMDSLAIHNLVRALARPYPGAHIVLNGKDEKVWKVSVDKRHQKENIEPGKVLQIKERQILVKTGTGAIWLIDHTIEDMPKEGTYLL